jgi:hypothetical protein
MNDHQAWQAPLSVGIEHLMCDTGRFINLTGDKEEVEEEDEEVALA